MSTSHIAIIGAGISGLSCARDLTQAGLQVTLFDKARGPGGRMASRRFDEVTIDHGAQYFTVNSPEFRHVVDRWSQAGVIAVWQPRLVDLGADGHFEQREDEKARYVGTPRMSALTRHLSRGVDVSCGVRIASITGSPGHWQLTDDEQQSYGPFTHVLVSAPAAQSSALLEQVGLAGEVANISSHACWAGMFAFAERLPVPWDAAHCDAESISWIARNSSKPGRGATETWVVHASPSWSDRNVELTPDEVLPLLEAEFLRLSGCGELPTLLHRAAHRWRLARPASVLDQASHYDPDKQIGFMGDYCLEARVEAAWLSGHDLAATLLASTSVAA